MFAAFLRVAALLLLSGVVMATEAPANPDAAIRARLASAMPGVEITSVTASPIAGLYQVVLDGSETAFASADGTYLVSGDLYQAVPGKGMVNVTDQQKGSLRRNALAKVDRKDLITFPSKGKEKGVVYAFTDVDCGYCRKLHQEVPQLNEAGITVHYLAFPRSGVEGETYRKMNAVWCAADRNKAITDSKRGSAVPAAPAMCKSPVAEQYKLGVAMGVRGTPAVFLVDGSQVGGYVPAAKLIGEVLK